MNRRSFIKSFLLGLTAFAPQKIVFSDWIATASGAEDTTKWQHGIAKFGNLKYPPAFNRFDYVNLKAFKGGAASQIVLGTFDNFNIVVAGIKGALAAGIDLVHDTLLASSLDEVSSSYGLLAEAISYPPDVSAVTFRLRREAKWHDASPVTADDVIFSFDAFKKLNPQASAGYRAVSKAQALGERDVKFTFDGPGHRDVIQSLGQLTILSKHWWEGTNSEGGKRNIASTTLEMPLGSGPYRMKEFSPGHSVIFERVKDYWARDLNVNVGRDNFDELRFEYFRDATIAVEAFKADLIDWRTENSAKTWATGYDFSAVAEKRVVLEEFPINNVGLMQAFVFNLRRSKFKDPRVRMAFNYAFDFEEINKKLFFGQYKRIASFFEGTELASSGVPTGRELEILETVRDKIPPEVFTKPFTNPVGGSQSAARNNLREALKLFREAGFVMQDQQIINVATKEPFEVELLTNAPLFERIYLFYKPWLERLGMTVSVRTVDEAHYENRLRSWDFDIVTFAWGQSLLPGNELRGYFGSAAADEPGSDNIGGIKNPAVDEIINKLTQANSEEEVVAAARALDRVLLWNHYVVPQWGYPKLRTARWNRFSYNAPLPKYGMSAFPTLWWWDAEKAEKTGGGKR